MADSVSTCVVVWNEAADSHESVASDAFVMPISSGGPAPGAASSRDQFAVGVSVAAGVHPLAGQELRVAGLPTSDPPGHLAHDQLDVLVVDRHALLAVHRLHLVHEVLLDGVAAP